MPLFKLDKLDKLEERKDTEELKELKELKELGRDSLFGIHASPGGILLWSICHMALFFWGPPGLHPAYVGGSMLLVTAFGISTLIAIEWISVKALFELYNLVAISNKELNKMAEDSGWQEPPEDP